MTYIEGWQDCYRPSALEVSIRRSLKTYEALHHVELEGSAGVTVVASRLTAMSRPIRVLSVGATVKRTTVPMILVHV